MAQNITLMGASYSGVPGVNLPKTGGGQAYFVDSSDANAAASDIATGKTAYVNGTKVTGTNSGGGGGGTSKKQINFIDYDGTILYAYTKAEINAMTSESDLPANPSHTGLTAQGWNWTLAQIKAQLTAVPNGDVWVGQMYITQSGNTEIDVSMPYGRLSPTLTICVNGEITVDWGDNTTPDTVTGTSLTTRKAVPHTYASEGDYTISIHVVSGKYAFYNSSSYLILCKGTTANSSRVYANCIQIIRLGSGITSIGNYAFQYCSSLASITIPNTVTSIGKSAFYYCYSLANITIPNTVTSIGGSAFNTCSSLASVTIPNTVTSIGTYAFSNCSSLASVTISHTVTSISDYEFQNCYSLASITIPDTVTSIGNNAFSSCYGMAEYHILPTTPPTLGSSVFGSIQSDCKIYVSSASLSTYQTASNWSTYASYMVGE